jgi:branched-chain amino acid transport system substrate-binding protein
MAKFARENLQAPTAAVLYDVASEYNKGIADVFKASFEQNGGKVVSFETYTTGDKDFSAQLTKIKDSKPDVVFLPNYYSEVPLQVQQAHRLGITVPFLGSDSWGSEELIKLCGKDCEGYYFSTHYAADNATPVAKKFIDAYKAKYNATPDDVAALTYDAFGLLWTALKNAGKVDRQAVRDAMAQIPSYDGVTGSMQFKEGSGDPIKSAVILQIKDGAFHWFANAKP